MVWSTELHPPMIQFMTSRRIGGKPLSETQMAYFIDIYMRHPAPMS